ncbi:MAG TPA: hypothetical protein VNC50_14805, partial [Planctomycetia bacterium]|nr:hypothetical protein [Planctomycetia bacterium]
MLENVPEGEAARIDRIVELTGMQMQRRYGAAGKPFLRGVHAKGHGCAAATLEVLPDLPEHLRRGLFATPGRKFEAVVRFSNADPLVRPDSTPGANGAPPSHGSRGMAIKVKGAEGPMLGPALYAAEQDFLMVNQPVFAFANVEDYEVLSRVLQEDNDDAKRFFVERLPPPGTTAPSPSQLRARETGLLVARVRSPGMTAVPPAFQVPPASPLENDYFGAAPFLFGPDQVMRYRARATLVPGAPPDVADPDYLRQALVKRLSDAAQGPVVFHFEAQIRPAASIDPEADIENASHGWAADVPFEPLAMLTIPPQEI